MEEKFEIYYVRHALTEGGKYDDRCECDIDLNEIGEKQIKLLAERFKGQQFDAVISSPLIRCVKTAAAVANVLKDNPTIEIIPEFIENGTIPGYTGADLAVIKKFYDNSFLCKDKIFDIKSNITDEENDERARILVNYLKNRFTYGQKIIIFCHGSFGNHFIPACVEMGEGNYILSISNTSISKIKYTSDGKQRISFLNDISHLRPLMKNYEFDT